MLFALVLAVAITILAVFFANYNQTTVVINLFGYALQGPIGLFLVIALGLGVLVGVLMLLPSVISRSWTILRHKRKMEELEDTYARKMSGGDELR
jgi:uncharacterized integral membrane protein